MVQIEEHQAVEYSQSRCCMSHWLEYSCNASGVMRSYSLSVKAIELEEGFAITKNNLVAFDCLLSLLIVIIQTRWGSSCLSRESLFRSHS